MNIALNGYSRARPHFIRQNLYPFHYPFDPDSDPTLGVHLYYMKCSNKNTDYSNEKHPSSPITHPHQLGLRCMDRLGSSIHTSSMRDASLRRVASTPVSKLLHHGRAKEIAKQVTIHHHSIAVVPSISFPIASRPESRTPFLFQI
jgi:hypothetical protein